MLNRKVNLPDAGCICFLSLVQVKAKSLLDMLNICVFGILYFSKIILIMPYSRTMQNVPLMATDISEE